jgi:hypothetical protein
MFLGCLVTSIGQRRQSGNIPSVLKESHEQASSARIPVAC